MTLDARSGRPRGSAFRTGVVLTACLWPLGCYGGRTGATAMTDGGPSTGEGGIDATTADGTVIATGPRDGASDARVVTSIEASEDSAVEVVCPTSPPVNFDSVPGFVAACTRIVFAAGGGSNNEIAVAFDDAATTWQRAFSSPDAGQYASVTNVVFGLGFGEAVGSNLSLRTSNGTAWSTTDGGILPTGNRETAAFLHNEFTFIAVQNGSGYSFDGIAWEYVHANNPYTTGALANFNGFELAYGLTDPDAGTGIYIVVGQTSNQAPDGGSQPVYAGYRTSTDGENWSDDIALPNSSGQKMGGFISSIAYGNGRFVMVGDGNGAPSPSADGLLATSTDGKTWTVQTNDDRSTSDAVSFSAVARSTTTFVIAKNQYTSPGRWTSADGVTWTMNTTLPGLGTITGFENYLMGGPVSGQNNGVVTVSTDNGQTWSFETPFPDKVNVASLGIGRILKGQ